MRYSQIMICILFILNLAPNTVYLQAPKIYILFYRYVTHIISSGLQAGSIRREMLHINA